MTKRRPTNLPRWQELAVYLSFGLLLVTGIAWLIFDRWVRISGEFGPEHHPAQHIMLIAHAIGAYAFLVIVGAMVPVHIPLGWHQRRNLASGITVVSICALLAVTGLGLYYAGNDTLRGWTSQIHWVVGLLGLAALIIHVLRKTPTIPLRAGSQRRPDPPTRAG